MHTIRQRRIGPDYSEQQRARKLKRATDKDLLATKRGMAARLDQLVFALVTENPFQVELYQRGKRGGF